MARKKKFVINLEDVIAILRRGEWPPPNNSRSAPNGFWFEVAAAVSNFRYPGSRYVLAVYKCWYRNKVEVCRTLEGKQEGGERMEITTAGPQEETFHSTPVMDEVTQRGGGEALEISPQSSADAGTCMEGKPYHPTADGSRQKHRRVSMDPTRITRSSYIRVTRGRDKGGKPSTRTDAHHSNAGKVQKPFRLPKPKGASMVTQLEQRSASSKGTRNSTDTTTASHEHNVSEGAERKRVLAVEGEIIEDDEMVDVVNTQWSDDHIEGSKQRQLLTEDVPNIQPHNPAGQLPDQDLAPAGGSQGTGNDLSCTCVIKACIDNPNEASDWTSIHNLEDRLEAAYGSYTHANVTLQYVNSRSGYASVLPSGENTFITTLAQCHMMICALCSYVQCSHVQVTAHLLNMK